MDDMHLDHVIPRVQGGTDEDFNLVISCPSCNLKKSGRAPSEAGMKLVMLKSLRESVGPWRWGGKAPKVDPDERLIRDAIAYGRTNTDGPSW